MAKQRRRAYNVDFVGARKIAAMMSFVLVCASILLFFVRGPTWGIDFTGGTEIHLKFEVPTTIDDVRNALTQQGLSDDAVQQIGSEEDYEYVIRIQDPEFGVDGIQTEVEGKLKESFGDNWIEETKFDAQIGARLVIRYSAEASTPFSQIQQSLVDVRGAQVQPAADDYTFYVKLPGLTSKIEEALKESLVENPFIVLQTDSVGPKVGDELKTQGVVSILATLALILIYVSIRFNLTFAPGAVLALFHDVILVIGIFIILDILGWKHEFNLPMVGALLTIIGYSLNDTIVIYDRIRENMIKYRREDTTSLINDSINDTLARTLATSITTFLAMMAFLILGGPVIKTFALAILLGVIIGTYSTIYVASPTILLMEDIQPYLSKLFSPLASKEDRKAV